MGRAEDIHHRAGAGQRAGSSFQPGVEAWVGAGVLCLVVGGGWCFYRAEPPPARAGSNSSHDFFSAFFLARFLERIFRPKLLPLSRQGSEIEPKSFPKLSPGGSGCNFVIFF